MRPAIEIADAMAGFVVGEGSFLRSTGPPSFTFRVALGATDATTVEQFAAFFGVGTVHRYPRRKQHYDDEVVFQVRKLRDLVEVVVPFLDEHLTPSHKREQYLEWRAQLVAYWEHEARRRRTCTAEGCDEPQRAKGLCRQHYFKAYRR